MNRIGLEINEDLIKMVNEVDELKRILDAIIMENANKVAEKIDLRIELSMQLVIDVEESSGKESANAYLIYPKITIYNNLNEIVGMMQIEPISIDKLCKIKNIDRENIKLLDLNKYYMDTLNSMDDDNIIQNPLTKDIRNLVCQMLNEVFGIEMVLTENEYTEGILCNDRHSVFNNEMMNMSACEIIKEIESTPKHVEPINYQDIEQTHKEIKETLRKYGLDIELENTEESDQEIKEAINRYGLDISIIRDSKESDEKIKEIINQYGLDIQI